MTALLERFWFAAFCLCLWCERRSGWLDTRSGLSRPTLWCAAKSFWYGELAADPLFGYHVESVGPLDYEPEVTA